VSAYNIDLVGGGRDPRVLGEVEHVSVDNLPPETLTQDLPGLPPDRRGLFIKGFAEVAVRARRHTLKVLPLPNQPFPPDNLPPETLSHDLPGLPSDRGRLIH